MSSNNNLVVDAKDLTKVFTMGDVEVHALRGLSVQIKRGEVISIMGPSGSGKTTLMNILGCLDRPTSGEYCLDGESIANLKDEQLATIRNRKVGFVFQLAKEALVEVGLGDRISHRPNELSGGQQQRVAIARALVNEPAIIMADEPTGNLDSKSGDEIMELLMKMNQEKGTTLIIVTHDPEIAEQTQRIIHIRDGVVTDH